MTTFRVSARPSGACQSAPLSDARQRPAPWHRKIRRAWRWTSRDDRQIVTGLAVCAALASVGACLIPGPIMAALAVMTAAICALGIRRITRYAMDDLADCRWASGRQMQAAPCPTCGEVDYCDMGLHS